MSEFKSISIERAIVALALYAILSVQVDPDKPQALRLTLTRGNILRIEPDIGTLKFWLATERPCDTIVGQSR